MDLGLQSFQPSWFMMTILVNVFFNQSVSFPPSLTHMLTLSSLYVLNPCISGL